MASITRRQTLRSSGLQPAIILKNICIDRSGSMSSFNGKQYEMTEKILLDTWKQTRETNVPTKITLKAFDNTVNIMLCDVDPRTQDTPSLQIIREALSPRGMTRLNDTILESLDELKRGKEEYLASLSNEARNLNPKIVQLLVVVTDGMDNESDSSKDDVKEKVLEFRDEGGEALLMAANMDAQIIGAEYGFNDDQCLTVHNSDQTAIESGFRSLSLAIRTASAGTPSPGFSQLQREESLNITPSMVVPIPSLTTLPTLTRQVARPVSPTSIIGFTPPTSPTSITDLTPPTFTPTYQTGYADLISSQRY